ncbi:MAG: DUF6088 family protein [Myxococcales bacterium]
MKEFLSMGRRPAIDKSLSRLARVGKIFRVARGIYFRPSTSRSVGKTSPDLTAIAQAVAAGSVVDLNGADAAYRLGLAATVPSTVVFFTSGSPHRFHVGDQEIVLKHVNPRRMALAGTPAGTALSALRHLGRRKVTPEVLSQVRRILPPEEFGALRSAATSMPGWLAAALNEVPGDSLAPAKSSKCGSRKQVT